MHLQRFFPKSKGSKSHFELPRLRVSHWEDEPLKHLAYIPAEITFRKPRVVWKIETTLLNSTNKISCLGTQGRHNSLKETWIRPTCSSWGGSERQEAAEAHPGDIDMSGSQFGELIPPQGHWCWQLPVWIAPSNFISSRT